MSRRRCTTRLRAAPPRNRGLQHVLRAGIRLTAPKFPLAIVPAACDGCGPARSAADAQFRLRRAGARPEDPRHAQARARHDAVGKSGGRRRARGGANRRGSFRGAPFNRTPVPASSETMRFDADVQFHVVMSSEELARAGLDALAKKWSKRLLYSKAKRRLF